MTEQQFFVAAVPVFLAAVLGVAVGFFTDRLKTRRENRKLSHERQEKEQTQLNGAATAVAYNIEVLLHIVMQLVLPHHERSHAAAGQGILLIMNCRGLRKTLCEPHQGRARRMK